MVSRSAAVVTAALVSPADGQGQARSIERAGAALPFRYPAADPAAPAVSAPFGPGDRPRRDADGRGSVREV